MRYSWAKSKQTSASANYMTFIYVFYGEKSLVVFKFTLDNSDNVNEADTLGFYYTFIHSRLFITLRFDFRTNIFIFTTV